MFHILRAMASPAVTVDNNDGMHVRGGSALWGLLLVILAFVVYWPVRDCGFIWDDNEYVTQNSLMWEPEGLRKIWFEPTASPQYYPLVFTTFWIEQRLWGVDSAGQYVAQGYHLVNVLFHGLGAALFGFVLRRLHIPGAWLAAAVFVVHPVMVESVAWISERKNVLAGVFYFSSLLAYLKFSSLGSNAALARKWHWYAVSLFCFALALASKSVTCTLPAAVLVIVWWKTGRITWRDAWPTLPFIAIGIAFGVLTVWMERNIVFLHEAPPSMTMAEQVLIAGRVPWFYAWKILWPTNLAFVYSRWTIDPSQWRQWMYPIGVVFLIGTLWMARSRIGRGPLAGTLLFGGTLFPAMGFFDVYPFQFSYVADHYQYLAAAWLIALLAGCGATMVRSQRRWNAVVAGGAGVIVLVLLAILTRMQLPIYQNVETLCVDTLGKNRNCWQAHNNLSVVRLMQGRIDESIEHGRTTVQLKPDHYPGRLNLSAALLTKGLAVEAEAEARAATAIRPTDGVAYLNLAIALEAQGKVRAAMLELREALHLDSTQIESAQRFAKALEQQRKHATALEIYDLILEVDSSNDQARTKREAIKRQSPNRSPGASPPS